MSHLLYSFSFALVRQSSRTFLTVHAPYCAGNKFFPFPSNSLHHFLCIWCPPHLNIMPQQSTACLVLFFYILMLQILMKNLINFTANCLPRFDPSIFLSLWSSFLASFSSSSLFFLVYFLLFCFSFCFFFFFFFLVGISLSFHETILPLGLYSLSFFPLIYSFFLGGGVPGGGGVVVSIVLTAILKDTVQNVLHPVSQHCWNPLQAACARNLVFLRNLSIYTPDWSELAS